MIIIEGADGVGKTTLCKKLLNSGRLDDHVYAHFTRLPAGFDYHWGYAERMSPRVVQDRFHMSEIVYAAARGEASQLTPELYRLVDARLRLIGAYVVLVVADEGLVKSRWDASQMYDLEKTAAAARMFKSLCDWAAYIDADSKPAEPDRFAEYAVDIDQLIVLNEERPYATDDDVDLILEAYLHRQQAVRLAASRRPVAL
jgi:hypothetical protein